MTLLHRLRRATVWPRGQVGAVALGAVLMALSLVHNTFAVRALFYGYLVIFASEYARRGPPLRQATAILWGSLLARAVLAYLGYAALSTLWSATVEWDEVLRGVVKCLAIAIFLLSIVFYGRRTTGLIGSAVVLGATTNCVVSLALFLSSGQQLFLDRLDGVGMKAIAISTAASYALAILVLSRSRILTNCVARAVLCSVLLAGMILTMSRGPLWALAAAIGISVAPHQRKRVVWTIVASLLCVAAASFSMHRMGKFYDLMVRPSWRIAIWREADKKLIADDLRLLFGFGLGDETIYSLPGDHAGSPPLVLKDMAHNAYLSNLTKTGIIGSCLLLCVIVNALRLAHKSRRSCSLLLAWLVFALGSMLTDYQIIKSFGFEYVLFWLPIGWLCVFEINDMHRSQAQTTVPPKRRVTDEPLSPFGRAGRCVPSRLRHRNRVPSLSRKRLSQRTTKHVLGRPNK